jgi:hypothetical protein
MAERALRGTRLGAVSYENDNAVDFAPRQVVAFRCANDHTFSLPFAEEAELPTTWECRKCGAVARRVDGAEPLVKATKPARTHWDMLLERRSVDDLEELLAERLALLRGPKRAARKSA